MPEKSKQSKGKQVSKTKKSDSPIRGQGKQTVYQTLRDEILSLELEPGSPLDEMQLSRRFGMSRSPIREALSRLSAENLVVMLTNRSTLVAPLEFANFPRYVEALDLMQRINTRLAAENRTEKHLIEMSRLADQFAESVERNNALEMSEVNRAFHMAIADAGANPYFTRMYGQLLDEGRRMLHLHFNYLSASIKDEFLTSEHHDMVNAIRDQDVERADTLAHLHTRQFNQRFMSFLQSRFDDSFDLTVSFNKESVETK